MQILPDLTNLSDAIGQAILQGQAWLAGNALPLSGTLCLAALASEVLPRIFPIKDPRTRFLARQLGVSPDDITPIGDGVQLWLDARGRLNTNDAASSCPTGCPTLKASYVVRQKDRLLLLCVHGTDEAAIEPNRDHEGLLDATVPTIDHATGNVHAAKFAVEPEADAVLRANLIEATANTRFGYKGAVLPVILWKDPDGIAPDPEDERTLSGLKPVHLRLDEAGGITGSLPAPRGQLHNPKGYARLSRWLRRQPSRATPWSRLAIRGAVVALAGWIVLHDPAMPGHERAIEILSAGRVALGL